MSREPRRPRSAADEPDVPRDRAPEPPIDHRLLALQRSAGNQAVARLVAADNALYAPRAWLDQKAGSKTLRELMNAADSKLAAQLAESLPRPGLKRIRETDSKSFEHDVLWSAPADDPTKRSEYVAWAQNQLSAVDSFVELTDIESMTRATPTPIMRPGDLVPEPDDLKGKDVKALKTLWCVLIAIVFSEGMPAVRAELEKAGMPKGKLPKTDSEDLYYKAMHDFYYGEKKILYDDTAAKPGLLASYGYSLYFAGPTKFAQLWKAKLNKDDRLIVDIPTHTMHVKVKEDFNKAEDAKKPLSTVFTLHNVKANWDLQDQATFGKDVLYVFKRK